MLTEGRNSQTTEIDQLDTLTMLERINDEDLTVAELVRRALPQIAQAVDAIVAALDNGGRLFYVGAGTSGRLGVLDASECVPTFGVSPDLVQGVMAGGIPALYSSVEDAEDQVDQGRADLLARGLTAGDVVVGIAASGTTPYVLGALALANEIGAVTVGLACNVPSPLLDAAQIKIGVPVGAEVISGSTRMKAGTAQKMVLNMLSTASMVKLGKVYGNLMVDVRVTNAKLARRAARIVSGIAGISEDEAAALLAKTRNSVKAAVVVSRLGVTPDEAFTRLAAVKGRLREIIG